MFDLTQPLPASVLAPISAMPGGQYATAHVNDGPYWILLLDGMDQAHWTVGPALAHYPHLTFPIDGYLWTNDKHPLRHHQVVLVPALVKDLLDWNNDTDGLLVLEEFNASFEAFPTASQLDDWLSISLAVACSPQPPLQKAVAGALAELGVRPVLVLLGQLDPLAATSDDVVTLLAGVSAPVPTQLTLAGGS